jgi:hypothetical protein
MPISFTSNYAWQRIKVMKLIIMQFSPASYYFISLFSPNFSSPPSQNPSASVLPLMSKDQVSQPYKTTDKIMVLYILIFTFLDSRTRRQTVLD